jgi:hypothetical protein
MSADIIPFKKDCHPTEICAIVSTAIKIEGLETLNVLHALERAIIAHIEACGWGETADVLIEAANLLILCKPMSEASPTSHP